MNKILKEPLFHFLILGSLIYLVFILLGNKSGQTQEIIVSQGKIEHLITLYKKTWQRKPTDIELQYIVHEYILGQAAYYEGIRLGLDKNDIVITRRLRQKINFIAEAQTKKSEATDLALTSYLHQYPEKFIQEPRFTIQQVYLNPKKQGNNLKHSIEKLLISLNKNPNQILDNLGDSNLFKSSYQAKTLSELKHTFGHDFVQTLNQLDLQKWYGWVQSSYGVHLVYIMDKQPAYLPELNTIRDKVLQEWKNSLQEETLRQYFDKLLSHYHVTIDWPKQEAGNTKP